MIPSKHVRLDVVLRWSRGSKVKPIKNAHILSFRPASLTCRILSDDGERTNALLFEVHREKLAGVFAG